MIRTCCAVLMFTIPICAGTLRLAAAQQLLFKNNLEILAAEEEVARVTCELDEAHAAYWPSLDATGSYSYLSEPTTIHLELPPPFPGMPDIVMDKTLNAQDKAECGLNLTYPFFTGFQRHYAVRSRKEMLEVKRADAEAVRNRVSLALGGLYLHWELSCKQVELRTALVNQLDALVRQLTAMKEAGTVLNSRLLDARARHQLAKVDLMGTEYQRDSLGLEVQAMLLLRDNSLRPDTTGHSFDTLPVPKKPHKVRPEFLSLDHATAQVEEMRAALKYRHFPFVSGMAGVRYGRPGLSLGRNGYMGWGLIGVQAHWNIFDGFKTRTQESLLMRQINFIDIERTRRTEYFRRSFELSRAQLNNACGRLIAAENARDAARAFAEDITNNFEAGTVTNAEVLDAVTRNAQAELVLESAKTMKQVALLKLMHAAGVVIKF